MMHPARAPSDLVLSAARVERRRERVARSHRRGLGLGFGPRVRVARRGRMCGCSNCGRLNLYRGRRNRRLRHLCGCSNFEPSTRPKAGHEAEAQHRREAR